MKQSKTPDKNTYEKGYSTMSSSQTIEEAMSPLVRRLPLLVTVLCALQPLMDVMSFWQAQLGMSNTLTLALRFGVLAVVALLGFFLSSKKRIYVIAAIICAALWVGHFYACTKQGYLDPFSDVTNYIRVLQMPLFAVCFITFMKRNQRCFDGLKRGFAINFGIITAVLIISVLTNTCRPTYDLSGLGYMGWFSTSNAQSAIMSMLTPVVVWMAYESKKHWVMWGTVILAYAQLFFIGTRLSFLAMVATTVGLTFTYFVTKKLEWKRVIAMFVCVIICVGCVKMGPMYKNRTIYSNYLDTQQGYASQTLNNALQEMEDSDDEMTSFADLPLNEKRSLLAPIYAFYTPELCRRFSAAKVMAAYDYSYTVSDLTHARHRKNTFNRLLQNEHAGISRVFGMELSRMSWQGESFDSENDFHGVYYLFGAVGLGLMIAFIGYFLVLILWALKKDAKKYFTPAAGAFGISLCIALGNAYLTAGVLRRPNSSFYLSALLAVIYYLVVLKEYKKNECAVQAPQEDTEQ